MELYNHAIHQNHCGLTWHMLKMQAKNSPFMHKTIFTDAPAVKTFKEIELRPNIDTPPLKAMKVVLKLYAEGIFGKKVAVRYSGKYGDFKAEYLIGFKNFLGTIQSNGLDKYVDEIWILNRSNKEYFRPFKDSAYRIRDKKGIYIMNLKFLAFMSIPGNGTFISYLSEEYQS